jgi:hypothetical protein
VNNDIDKEIVIENTITRCDYTLVSIVLLKHFKVVYAYKWFFIIILSIWLLSEPGYSSFFIKIILFALLPLLLLLLKLAITFYRQDKIIYSTLVFKKDYFTMHIKRNEIKLDYEVPLSEIKEVLNLKKYIVIFTTGPKFVIVKKCLDKNKEMQIVDYLNTSLEQLKNKTDPENIKKI